MVKHPHGQKRVLLQSAGYQYAEALHAAINSGTRYQVGIRWKLSFRETG